MPGNHPLMRLIPLIDSRFVLCPSCGFRLRVHKRVHLGNCSC